MNIDKYLQGGLHPATRLENEKKLADIDAEITQIEIEQHNFILQNNKYFRK